MLEYRVKRDGEWVEVSSRREVQVLLAREPDIEIEWREISEWRRVTAMPVWLR